MWNLSVRQLDHICHSKHSKMREKIRMYRVLPTAVLHLDQTHFNSLALWPSEIATTMNAMEKAIWLETASLHSFHAPFYTVQQTKLEGSVYHMEWFGWESNRSFWHKYEPHYKAHATILKMGGGAIFERLLDLLSP